MAYSVNGFGTTYKADTPLLSDGTFIVTKWILLFYVPVIPLGTYRVKYLDGTTFIAPLMGLSSTSQYQIIEKIPWDKRGMVKYALCLLGVIALITIINLLIY